MNLNADLDALRMERLKRSLLSREAFELEVARRLEEAALEKLILYGDAGAPAVHGTIKP